MGEVEENIVITRTTSTSIDTAASAAAAAAVTHNNTLSKFQRKIICFLYSKELIESRDYGITVNDLGKALGQQNRDYCYGAVAGLEKLRIVRKRPFKNGHINNIYLCERINEILDIAVHQFAQSVQAIPSIEAIKKTNDFVYDVHYSNLRCVTSSPQGHIGNISGSRLVDNPSQTLFVKNWGFREYSIIKNEHEVEDPKENVFSTTTSETTLKNSASESLTTTPTPTPTPTTGKNIYIFWDVLYHPEFIDQIKTFYGALERGENQFETYAFVPDNELAFNNNRGSAVPPHCDVERGLFRKIIHPTVGDECWAWRKLDERYFVQRYASGSKRNAEFALECQMTWTVSRVVASINAVSAERFSEIIFVAREQFAESLAELVSHRGHISTVCVRSGETLEQQHIQK